MANQVSPLNQCYLSTLSNKDTKIIKKYIDKANDYVKLDVEVPKFIQKHWAPSQENITEKEDF